MNNKGVYNVKDNLLLDDNELIWKIEYFNSKLKEWRETLLGSSDYENRYLLSILAFAIRAKNIRPIYNYRIVQVN